MALPVMTGFRNERDSPDCTLIVGVPRVGYEKLAGDSLAETSDRVRARTEAARLVARERLKDTKLACNAEMTPAEVRRFCRLEPEAQSLLRAAMKQFSLTARAFHRVLKLARTVADLDRSEAIKSHHLAEAIQYRPRSLV